jgi:type VI secretion system protein
MWLDLREEDQKFIDLKKHLAQLLNTRKGSVHYLPDYGLPDLNEIYQKLPESMGYLVSEVQSLILAYEPRLKDVNIIPYLSDEVDCVVYLKLQVKLVSSGASVNFETYFLSGGEAKIQWMD